jgi:hypothetical protein
MSILPRFRSAWALVLLIAIPVQVGCATYTAVKIPGPVADESIELGQHRSDVELTLKGATSSEYREGDGTTAIYRYKDGPPQASKGRVVLYIAGDVFTVFLSELIFWPIEAYASGRTDRVAAASYDAENNLVSWAVDRPGGERLISLGSPPPPTPPVASGSSAGASSVEKSGYRKTAR